MVATSAYKSDKYRKMRNYCQQTNPNFTAFSPLSYESTQNELHRHTFHILYTEQCPCRRFSSRFSFYLCKSSSALSLSGRAGLWERSCFFTWCGSTSCGSLPAGFIAVGLRAGLIVLEGKPESTSRILRGHTSWRNSRPARWTRRSIYYYSCRIEHSSHHCCFSFNFCQIDKRIILRRPFACCQRIFGHQTGCFIALMLSLLFLLGARFFVREEEKSYLFLRNCASIVQFC